ncbi:MAG TPA: AcrB/AcrD/AcrF family protein, partial [Gammaproteobacteria bacterium]|nr:AcrB/AcrD/AcrF family protein [Gammaproteobacteria bacterium]
MNLPELSIRRHVLAYMLNAVLVLFGIIGFRDLGVDRFPNVDIPVISITTIQPGANPSVVDASITNIIERQVNSVPGIKNIRSSSTPGVSVVAINFELEKDVDVAFNEVQAKVNQVLNQLPTDADPPIVAKLETSSQPILWLALQGNRTEQQLNVYANNVLRKQLENVNGVGEVRIAGSRERTVRVEVDPARLASYGLTVQDLIQAFQREHFLLPGGFVVGGNTESLLKLDLEYHDPAALGQMVIGFSSGAPIRLQDVGEVVDGLADYRQLARFNGEPTVGLGIVKIAGSNTVAIIDEIKARLDTEIGPQLPPGLKVSVATDTSTFILEMVHALQEHLITGTLLAAAVVLLFLRNFRSTLIIAAAIPVSLLGAVAVMYFFGYTFNVVTLLALLLLIGVVVDDAIVVLENIYRHREELDPDPVSAAMNGTQEVMFAVLAATLSLVSIFVPVVFMGGIVGRFFESFAVVVVFGVLVSWFVALTLTPMM